MIIDDKLLEILNDQSLKSPRNRINFNFHPSDDDLMHRMINVIQPGSYVQPHKHENPDKHEAFIILNGRLLVVLFDDMGNISQYHILDRETNTFGIEIKPGTFHTIIALEPNTSVYEVKHGPYDVRNDKVFALWAPSEDQVEKAIAYQKKLLKKAL